MEMIEVSDIDRLNYYVCAWITRNRLQTVRIHCKASQITENLFIYMAEIGMPCSSSSEDEGVILLTDLTGIDMDTPHVIITQDPS